MVDHREQQVDHKGNQPSIVRFVDETQENIDHTTKPDIGLGKGGCCCQFE